jgi:crotonobetainyl-CoA:carnitine CoA-transferase CaiB-like acyl-CoA transferase
MAAFSPLELMERNKRMVRRVFLTRTLGRFKENRFLQPLRNKEVQMDEPVSTAVSQTALSAASLSGIKVLDLSRFIAGPYCAMLLGDLGADVIKVESRSSGDNTRAFEPKIAGESLYTIVFNRNKRSMTLDFRNREAQDLLRELIAKADVVVENFVPGTLEKMGCGWEVMHKANPRLVMVRISGFGQSGPYAERPCFDVIAQAMSGIMEMTGAPDAGPTMVGTYMVDYSTALYATVGTLAALQARERSGRGQMVDVSLLDSAISFHCTAIAECQLTGVNKSRNGNRDRYSAPGNTFRTKDNDWVHLVAAGEQKFESFAAAMERPDLPRDPRFSTNSARLKNADDLEPIVAAWVAELSTEETLGRLNKAGIPNAKIARLDDVIANPQLQHRKQIIEMDHPIAGKIPMQGFTVGLSETPMCLRRASPVLGEHTAEVLSQWIDADEKRLSDLRNRKII